ncbi:hypothetical protein [Marinomonas sp.]|uniref:hypothetical protein n=1 Tax=Marinomonas sp. TaxID=1904862 RepID=UPI003A94F3F2
MPIESSLSEAQRESITIKNFIFHVIEANPDPAKKMASVIEVDEVTLEPEQRKFFEKRFRSTAEGTQFVFTTYGGDLKKKGLDILNNAKSFNQISKDLARSFTELHKGQMSDGVFVVSLIEYEFRKGQKEHALFLVKINRQASFPYRYKRDEMTGRVVAHIDNSPTSLVQDNKAISKSAIIDLTDEFLWDVLAVDANGHPSITDYFKDFMSVTEREKDSVLTVKANSAVREWTRKNISSLPEGENYNTFTGRAYEYIKANSEFNTEEYIKYIVKDSNKDNENTLRKSLREHLNKKGVGGQKFKLYEGSIKTGDKTNKYTTEEGVEVTYNGDQEKAGIKIAENKDYTIVTITTKKLTTNVKK